MQAFRSFIGPFAPTATASRVLCAFGDDRSALVTCEAETTLITHAPGAGRLDARQVSTMPWRRACPNQRGNSAMRWS